MTPQTMLNISSMTPGASSKQLGEKKRMTPCVSSEAERVNNIKLLIYKNMLKIADFT